MKKSKERNLKPVIILISVLFLLLLLVLYGYVANFYRSHYFPHTTIGTVSCGNKTAAQVVTRNIALNEDYVLSVYDINGNKFNINGEDFDYTYGYAPNEEQQQNGDYSDSEEARILQEQNPWAWPAELGKEHTYEIDTENIYDSAKLEEKVRTLGIFDSTYAAEPANAYVTLTKDGYEVVAEDNGNMPIPEKVISAVSEAVKRGENLVQLTAEDYETAEITQDDEVITSLTAELDSYLNSTIHYEIEGQDENLTRQDIAGMLVISEDNKVSVDEDKVAVFVQKLATKYNTYGDDREFQTHAGDFITIGGGDYGWILSKANEKAQILEDLQGGKAVDREPVWEQTAVQAGADDIGDTYIEIDYTNQHLWYFVDGNAVLDFDIVSGNLSASNGSVDGVYYIKARKKDYTLKGEGYTTPVNYFLPFAYNIGIHDADSWRSEYGGNIFRTGGSHGCVNAPLASVEELYDLVKIGTPVIAYYRESVTLTNYAAQKSNAYSYKGSD